MPALAKQVPSIRRGNKNDIAAFFDVNLSTVDAWIRRGMPAVQQGRQGSPWVFDLLAVAGWRFAGLVPGIAQPGEQRDPEDLEPRERDYWYAGEDKRRKLAREAGELIEVAQHRADLADSFKTVAQFLEILPDILERDCGLSGETIARVQQVIDHERDELADRVEALDIDVREPEPDQA